MDIDSNSFKIGFFAPSSRVSWIELQEGLAELERRGFDFVVSPQVKRSHLFFAGTDEERARAFWEMARDPSYPVLWAARGGYGSARILGFLDRWTKEQGAPPTGKLYVGYSDSTAMQEFVRRRWGWFGLHGEMPGLRKFTERKPAELKALCAWVKGELASEWSDLAVHTLGRRGLKLLHPGKGGVVEGEIVGGNLTVLCSLLGTPYTPDFANRVVFLEDTDEPLYRIDRTVQQLLNSGALQKARALVLGNFSHCRDIVPLTAARVGGPKKTPLRRELAAVPTLQAIFRRVGQEYDIPVFWGLPVGHGDEHFALPLGARTRLAVRTGARLEIQDWGWRGPTAWLATQRSS